jgi:hypothetical protein
MIAATPQGGHAGSVGQLSAAHLDPILDAALRRFSSNLVLGADEGKLSGVTIGLADLPGLALAQTNGKAILIDRDAAGMGWFVDSTPYDDSEFQKSLGGDALRATGDSPARGRADLLTVVMHELGHVAGLDHVQGNGFDLMSPSLANGLRLLPGDAAGHDVGAAGVLGVQGPVETATTGRAARVFDEAHGALIALDEARLLDALDAFDARNGASDTVEGEDGLPGDGPSALVSGAEPDDLGDSGFAAAEDGGEEGPPASADEGTDGGEWSLGKELVSGLSVDWDGQFSGFGPRR